MGKITRNELAPVLTQELDKAKSHLDDYASHLNDYESHLNNYSSHLADYVSHPAVSTTTNIGNDYSITLDPIPTEYKNGMGLILTINADSTGDATINVNGLGAIPIKKSNGNPVNNLKTNGVYTLRYSSVQSAFILQGEGGEYGTAIANDVIEGKTIGTEEGLVTGTMPNNGAVTITPSQSDQIIEQGYHSGAGVVKAVEFNSSDVIAGVTIAGKSGTMPLRNNINGQAPTGISHHLASNVARASGTIYLKPNPTDHSRVAYEGDCWVSYNDATFNPDNIIQGKPILGMQGNIPNYGRAVLGQGYTSPRSYKADGGGSLVIEPNWGYYEAGVNDNGFGSIILSDGNYKATSIVAGKSIFGLAGVAAIKRTVSGQFTTGSFADTNQTIYGLPFKPSLILCLTNRLLGNQSAIPNDYWLYGIVALPEIGVVWVGGAHTTDNSAGTGLYVKTNGTTTTAVGDGTYNVRININSYNLIMDYLAIE